jgi:hypothetical protein
VGSSYPTSIPQKVEEEEKPKTLLNYLGGIENESTERKHRGNGTFNVFK